LHQIAVIAPNNHWREKQTGRKASCSYLFACKVAQASRRLAGKVQRLDAAATFPGSLMPAPHGLSGTLNLVGFNLRQFNLIQLNSTKNKKTR
jgi:hypothetical protein